LQEKGRSNPLNENTSTVFGWFVIAAIGFGVYWFGFNNLWYAARYLLPPDKVIVENKPTDCDFLRAPLGTKGCHFEAVVTAYNAAGVVVGGTTVPKYGSDIETGKPIVSYDDGKNWDWSLGTDVSDPKVAKVTVAWSKVAD
jgi:hypothetical protein